MNRYEGAATGPPPAAEPPPRPARPAAVELAAAILVVGGALGLIGLAGSSGGSRPQGIEPFIAATILLDVGSIVIGLLIRTARLWLVAVNYAAVLGFLDLLGAGASPLALMLGVADVLVVLILLVNKPWFDAVGRWRAGD